MQAYIDEFFDISYEDTYYSDVWDRTAKITDLQRDMYVNDTSSSVPFPNLLDTYDVGDWFKYEICKNIVNKNGLIWISPFFYLIILWNSITLFDFIWVTLIVSYLNVKFDFISTTLSLVVEYTIWPKAIGWTPIYSTVITGK